MKDVGTTSYDNDLALIKLAREVAMDILPLETILKQHGITDEKWVELQRTPRFNILLSSEYEAWNTALNTHERVKVKSAAMIEEWLPILNARMSNLDETLPSVTEAAKMLSRLAGMGLPNEVNGNTGERFVVTINMGPQIAPLEFAKDVTSKVIDGMVVAGSDVINTVKMHESH